MIVGVEGETWWLLLVSFISSTCEIANDLGKKRITYTTLNMNVHIMAYTSIISRERTRLLTPLLNKRQKKTEKVKKRKKKERKRKEKFKGQIF